jgi:uncharacterized membrane protein
MRPNAILRAIDDWQKQNVIDAATAGRIRDYERTKSRPSFMGLLTLLGAIAIAFGIITLVASNWEELPMSLKLGMHLLLNAGLGYAAWRLTENTEGKNMAREGVLLVLSASTLALIAHIGQSFQITGTVSTFLGVWLVLVTPFTVLLVKSRLHRGLWVLGLAIFSYYVLEDHSDTVKEGWLALSLGLYIGLLYAAPLWLGRVGPIFKDWSVNVLHHYSLISMIFMVSMAQIGWRMDGDFIYSHSPFNFETNAMFIFPATLIIAAASFMYFKAEPTPALRAKGYFFTLAPLLMCLPVLFPHPELPLVGAGMFILIWLALGGIAVLVESNVLFNIAALFISMRLFVITLEVFGSLLATGTGLIIAGVLLLLLARLCHRIMAWGKRTIKRSPA